MLVRSAGSTLLHSLCTLCCFVLISLRNKVQNGPKKYRGMFSYWIEKHMQKFRHFWRKKKFHPKKSLTLVLHQAIQLGSISATLLCLVCVPPQEEWLVIEPRIQCTYKAWRVVVPMSLCIAKSCNNNKHYHPPSKSVVLCTLWQSYKDWSL